MPVAAPPRVVHRARPRDDRRRAHLVAVPAPPPAPAPSAEAGAVARDAQCELAAVGHVLHDGPVQSLIAASMALRLAECAERDTGEAATGVAYGLAEARAALDDALAALRGTVRDLNPPGVQGGLGQMLSALRQRAPGLLVDDRAAGAVSADVTGAVFRLLAALGATEADLPGVAVVTRDQPGVVVCEVRLRGRDAADRSRREGVDRALRRLDALGARAAVARAGGGADLLLALPSDTGGSHPPYRLPRPHRLPQPHRFPQPTEAEQPLGPGRGPALDDNRGDGRTGSAPALAPTGTEDWR